jgi:hypothetical protein
MNDVEALRYGSFGIDEKNGYARWNGDSDLQLRMQQTSYDFCQFETWWGGSNGNVKHPYETAITGLCLWSKYDGLLKFKAIEKGNAGAVRSLSNPKDRVDIAKRLQNGQAVEDILIAQTPFNQYQSGMLAWQAEIVRRFSIKKLYFSVPLDEYKYELEIILKNLSKVELGFIFDRLDFHFSMIQRKVFSEIQTEIEFVHPMRTRQMTPHESYTWPYTHLKVDFGVEEIEEIRIPYSAMKAGAVVPPIMLGMIGYPAPSYLHHDQHLPYDRLYHAENKKTGIELKEKSQNLTQSTPKTWLDSSAKPMPSNLPPTC